MFTTSPGKTADAKRLGADEVVISKNSDEMRKQANRFDFILNTVAAPHDLDAFLNLLRRDGTMCLVGAPALPHPSPSVFNLIFGRRQLSGSLIGGIRETQEMLDFCGEHNIVSDIEHDPDPEDQRGLRADAPERREIPLRHRHGVLAEGEMKKAIRWCGQGGAFYPLFQGFSRSRPPGSRPSCATHTHAIP